MNWKGVTPAITTPFNGSLSVDHGFLAEHCRWLLDSGCAGVVALGSLGEGATLSFDEKTEILRTLGNAVHGKGTLVASISSLTTGSLWNLREPRLIWDVQGSWFCRRMSISATGAK